MATPTAPTTTSITVESAGYLAAQGFAIYSLCITNPDGSHHRLAKRFSVLKAHHQALLAAFGVAGSAVCRDPQWGYSVPPLFPTSSFLATFSRGDPGLIENRKRSLNAYFASLWPAFSRALAKSLYNGDPGAAAVLPAGGSLPDGTFDSLYAPITIPCLSLTEYVLRRAGEAPAGHAAIIDGPSERTILYSELRSKIEAVAVGLSARGFKPGDVLAILAPNVPEYALAFHAVASLGGIVTTLNPLYTAAEICHQLVDAGASVLLTVKDFEEKAYEAASGATRVARVCLFDADADDDARSPPLTAFRSLLAADVADARKVLPSIDPSSVVAIPYSSGTSGLPKGVELTHRNLVANLTQITATHLKLGADDTLIGVLPFFHIYGMIVILNAAIASLSRVVSMPKFDPPAFLALLKKHEVTVAHVAPPIVGFLAKHPAVDAVLPLPKLRELFSGAAPLGGDLAAAAKARLGLQCVRQGYGMTEMSPASHIVPYHHADAKPASIGDLVPSTECRILDTESGAAVGVGERGEICIRGPNVMKGYLNKPEATAACIDGAGFLHTGDVGYVDADGCFYIVDRVKELIKVKGFQVAPAELEALLLSFAPVADAAVVGVPDAKAGELPKAYVVRQKGHEAVSEEEIKALVTGKVAAYKELGFVEFVESVPKSAAGKILRKELRKMEEERRAAKAG